MKASTNCLIAAAIVFAMQWAFLGQAKADSEPPLILLEDGYFFVGGEYTDPDNPMVMSGQMYVRRGVLSRSVRSLHGEIPDTSRSRERLRAAGGSEHLRQWDMIMLELNNQEVAALMHDWLRDVLRSYRDR
jgi:hypothetical protein